jgi:hypothetical protein
MQSKQQLEGSNTPSVAADNHIQAGETLMTEDRQQEDLIRKTERQRIEILVQGDVAKAKPFHADDFQLITPIGALLTRDEYLAAIGSGRLTYHSWLPHDIAVRVHGSAAVIRYCANLQVTFEGHQLPMGRCWHTDTYERRENRWVVVWSQATMITHDHRAP